MELELANTTLMREIAERTRAEQALRESEERFRLMADAAPVLIWVADTGTNCAFFNQRWLGFTGRTLEQERGSGWTGGVHPDDVQPCVQAFLAAFSARQDFQVEYRLRRFDGVYRWLFEIGVPRFTPDGEFAGYLGSCIDITERKQVEESLLRQTVELQQATEDLQQFARVAAHDLQEPLRMVTSYVQLLAQRYKGELGSDADEYIGFAIDGAKRLQRLILDLLAYYEVGTRKQEFTVVNGDTALTNALVDLRGLITETGAVITNDSLPSVWGDAGMIQLLFRNLIDNSIKFRRPESPRIHISARQETSEWFFSVRDNGIGMDPQYVDRVFKVFQRLHTRESYPKPGVGLAMCQKIVERHGGRIWIDSAQAQGTTVFFTLPILQPRQEPFSADDITGENNINLAQRLQ